METIYKGLPYTLTFSFSDETLIGHNFVARLYNKATKTVIQSDEWTVSDEDTHIRTTIWGTNLTVAMPVGVYSIDVIDEDMGDMLYHNDNHARCIETSKSLQS